MQEHNVNKEICNITKIETATPNQDADRSSDILLVHDHQPTDHNMSLELQNNYMFYSNVVKGFSNKSMDIINLLNPDEARS